MTTCDWFWQEGWYIGEREGIRGLLPSTHIAVLPPDDPETASAATSESIVEKSSAAVGAVESSSPTAEEIAASHRGELIQKQDDAVAATAGSSSITSESEIEKKSGGSAVGQTEICGEHKEVNDNEGLHTEEETKANKEPAADALEETSSELLSEAFLPILADGVDGIIAAHNLGQHAAVEAVVSMNESLKSSYKLGDLEPDLAANRAAEASSEDEDDESVAGDQASSTVETRALLGPVSDIPSPWAQSEPPPTAGDVPGPSPSSKVSSTEEPPKEFQPEALTSAPDDNVKQGGSLRAASTKHTALKKASPQQTDGSDSASPAANGANDAPPLVSVALPSTTFNVMDAAPSDVEGCKQDIEASVVTAPAMPTPVVLVSPSMSTSSDEERLAMVTAPLPQEMPILGRLSPINPSLAESAKSPPLTLSPIPPPSPPWSPLPIESSQTLASPPSAPLPEVMLAKNTEPPSAAAARSSVQSEVENKTSQVREAGEARIAKPPHTSASLRAKPGPRTGAADRNTATVNEATKAGKLGAAGGKLARSSWLDESSEDEVNRVHTSVFFLAHIPMPPFLCQSFHVFTALLSPILIGLERHTHLRGIDKSPLPQSTSNVPASNPSASTPADDATVSSKTTQTTRAVAAAPVRPSPVPALRLPTGTKGGASGPCSARRTSPPSVHNATKPIPSPKPVPSASARSGPGGTRRTREDASAKGWTSARSPKSVRRAGGRPPKGAASTDVGTDWIARSALCFFLNLSAGNVFIISNY